jgi:hypothetical protein
VNSDAAVVGLQAMHMLKGEFAAQLWGTSYQGCLDALLTAAVYLVTGPTPFGLFLVPLLGMCASIAMWFDILRRHLKPWAALACVMPLVVSPMAINMPMLYVLRQSLATFVCLGVWLCWRLAASTRVWWLLPVGGVVLGLAMWVDFFAITLVPAVTMLVLGAAWTGARGDTWLARLMPFALRLVAIAVGIGAGLYATVRLRGTLGGGASGGIDSSRISHNLDLLIHTCLPFTVGTKVFIKGEELYAQPWDAPLPVVVLQWAGAIGFALLLLFAAVSVLAPRTPAPVRWLALGGLAAAGSAVGGFVLSVMPADMWSSRYLAPLLWFAPLWLTPAAWMLTRRGVWTVLAPYLLSTAIGGWLSYGLYVDGPLPRRDPRGVADDEMALLQTLKADGVQGVTAQYWLAYRLTLLWKEELIAVPLNPGEDRYPGYRAAFNQAQKKALVFHPSEPRAQPGPYQQMLTSQHVPFVAKQVAGFTVLELQ